MKIIDVRIEESVLPKKDKDWKFALAANPATEGWIVSIRTEDGTVGYGYASTMNHYGAPHEAVKGALDRLSKRLIGRDSREIASILDDLDQAMMGNNQAKSGIDCALHDLQGAPARRAGLRSVRRAGGARIPEPAHPADQVAVGHGEERPRAGRQGRAAFQDQGAWRGRGGRGAGARRSAQSSGPMRISPSTPTSPIRPRMPSARSI